MRLIDADALLEVLRVREDEWNTPDETWRPEREYGNAIKNAPTVDVVEVRRGNWLIVNYATIECSECGAIVTQAYTRMGTRYCSNCGAKMDGENNDKD